MDIERVELILCDFRSMITRTFRSVYQSNFQRCGYFQRQVDHMHFHLCL